MNEFSCADKWSVTEWRWSSSSLSSPSLILFLSVTRSVRFAGSDKWVLQPLLIQSLLLVQESVMNAEKLQGESSNWTNLVCSQSMAVRRIWNKRNEYLQELIGVSFIAEATKKNVDTTRVRHGSMKYNVMKYNVMKYNVMRRNVVNASLHV